MLLLLLAPAAAWSAAPTWPGAFGGGGSGIHEITIPAGALPPGPAELRLADPRASPSHVVHFEMPRQASHQRLWLPATLGLTMDQHVDVVAVSDHGESWSTQVELWGATDPGVGANRFIGTSEQLTRFLDGVEAAGSSRTWRQRLQSGLQLADPTDPPDCRTLTTSPWVVADAGAGDLLACVARGARIVIVGGPAPAGIAAGAVHRWGRGLVGWSPDFDAAAGAAAIVLSGEGLTYEASFLDYAANTMAVHPPEGWGAGGVVVLVLLLSYVALIGPVGWFIGVRPRRAWLAWGWFPAVSAAATLGSFAVGLALRDPPTATVTRTTVIAPDGTGLALIQVGLHIPYGDSRDLQTTWHDADPMAGGGDGGFGSPFGSNMGPLRIREDRTTGKVDITGLTPASYGAQPLTWVEPIRQEPPDLRFDGPQIVFTNTGAADVVSGIFVAGGQSARFEAVPAGQSVRLALEATSIPTSDQYGWRDALSSQVDPQGLFPDSYVLGLQMDQPEDLRFTPEPQVESNDLLVIAGPLGEEVR